MGFRTETPFLAPQKFWVRTAEMMVSHELIQRNFQEISAPKEAFGGDSLIYSIDIYLPFPVIPAIAATLFVGTPFLEVPQRGSHVPETCKAGDLAPCIAPEDTYSKEFANIPSITAHHAMIEFHWIHQANLSDSPATVRISVPLKVSPYPFSDELLVPTVFSSTTSFGQFVSSTSFILLQPSLRTTAVFGAGSGCDPSEGVTLQPAGQPFRFSEPIHSRSTKFAQCQQKATGGSIRTLVIVIENKGRGPAFDVAVTCKVPSQSRSLKPWVGLVLSQELRNTWSISNGHGDTVPAEFFPPEQGYSNSSLYYNESGFQFSFRVQQQPGIASRDEGSSDSLIVITIDFLVPFNIPLAGEGESKAV